MAWKPEDFINKIIDKPKNERIKFYQEQIDKLNAYLKSIEGVEGKEEDVKETKKGIAEWQEDLDLANETE